MGSVVVSLKAINIPPYQLTPGKPKIGWTVPGPWTNGQSGEPIYSQMNRYIARWTFGRTDWWLVRKDWWSDRQMDGWMDGWMEGLKTGSSKWLENWGCCGS